MSTAPAVYGRAARRSAAAAEINGYGRTSGAISNDTLDTTIGNLSAAPDGDARRAILRQFAEDNCHAELNQALGFVIGAMFGVVGGLVLSWVGPRDT